MGTVNHLQGPQLQISATPWTQTSPWKGAFYHRNAKAAVSDLFCQRIRHNSCKAYWLNGLTVIGPGLDRHGALVKSKRVVKQVDLAVDRCVDDDVVLDGAVAVHQQVLGAVLHGGCDAVRVRVETPVRWGKTGRVTWLTEGLTRWSRVAQESRPWSQAGSPHRTCNPRCSTPTPDRSKSAGQTVTQTLFNKSYTEFNAYECSLQTTDETKVLGVLLMATDKAITSDGSAQEGTVGNICGTHYRNRLVLHEGHENRLGAVFLLGLRQRRLSNQHLGEAAAAPAGGLGLAWNQRGTLQRVCGSVLVFSRLCDPPAVRTLSRTTDLHTLRTRSGRISDGMSDSLMPHQSALTDGCTSARLLSFLHGSSPPGYLNSAVCDVQQHIDCAGKTKRHHGVINYSAHSLRGLNYPVQTFGKHLLPSLCSPDRRLRRRQLPCCSASQWRRTSVRPGRFERFVLTAVWRIWLFVDLLSTPGSRVLNLHKTRRTKGGLEWLVNTTEHDLHCCSDRTAIKV